MDQNWKFTRLGVLFVVLISQSLCLCWSLNDEGTKSTILFFFLKVILFSVCLAGKWRKVSEFMLLSGCERRFGSVEIERESGA